MFFAKQFNDYREQAMFKIVFGGCIFFTELKENYIAPRCSSISQAPSPYLMKLSIESCTCSMGPDLAQQYFEFQSLI